MDIIILGINVSINNNLVKKVFSNPLYFLAFGFGSGLMPRAPGTFGTLAALPIYYCLTYTSMSTYIVVTILAAIFGIYICEYVSRDLGEHDYPGIVWDEIVGYLVTMFLAPTGWIWMVIGFVLFRIFDIWKPFPIRWVDNYVSGGFGIMLDDLLAAIPAWGIIQLLRMIL